MFIKILNSTVMTVLALLTMVAGCQKPGDSGNDGDTGPTYSEADTAILKTFADDVVIPTYKSLDDKALALKDALVTLRDNPSVENLAAAKTAWFVARVPWEQSEGFLTGPVDTQGLDPAMDTWPVEPKDILKEVAKVEGNAIRDLSKVAVEAKGFHAIEYLLFGEAGSKTLASQTVAERSYLVSLATDVHRVTSILLASWSVSFNGGSSYRDQLVNSGLDEGARFATSSAAIDDIVQRLKDIADEVGATKIGGPHAGVNSNIESEYSDNSLTDFQNNIKGLRYVYQGSLTDTASEASIKARVKAKNADLDAKVEQLITSAIDAIKLIPAPFRTSVSSGTTSADQAITGAEDVLRQLRILMEGDVAETVQ